MAITFYATNNFTGNGSTTIWNINFSDGYLFTADVKARYVDNTGTYVDIPVTNVSGNVVTISPAQPAGRVFQIYRNTQKTEPLVDFADGAILNETNLDVMATQAVMVAAEASDLANGLVNTANIALANSEDALAGVTAAQASAASAQASATAAQSSATAAQSAASTAVTTANNALSVANGIAGTADTALVQSTAAVHTANTALSTANGIASTANTALSQSSAAVATANSANAAVVSKANKGANSDITSLSGLTTALSLSQGGTGGTDAATARTNLGLGTAAVANTGTSGANLPFLNGINQWSGFQNFTSAINIAALQSPLSIASGGTGANTAAGALIQLGAVGRLLNVRKLTASGTYIPTPGTTSILAYICGGGGGGGGGVGGSSTISIGAGGTSGVEVLSYITSVAASYSITVGSGGISSVGGVGTVGSASTIDTIATAPGGIGGGVLPPGTGLDAVVYTGTPTAPSGTFLYSSGSTAAAVGLRISGTTAVSGGGGGGSFGIAGTYIFSAGNGLSAQGFGAGGGGGYASTTSVSGGAGAAGCIVVYEFS